ncbi:MAG: hypothetical protein HY860_03875 [Chlamydiales bacterium]|nr:hypothetical protein [Chlamydiales bacterium]
MHCFWHMNKRFLFLSILLSFLLLSCLAWRHHQKNFFAWKIISVISPRAKWDTEASSLPNEALTQKYSFLAKGSQCYAFLSEDQKYVIKFFKKKHYLPKSWIKYIPFVSLLDYHHNERLQHYQKRLELGFDNYKRAYEDLKEESALLAVHINPTTNRYPSIVIKDKKGQFFTIPLDRTPFILQKKAELLVVKLAEQKSNPKSICDAIVKLVEIQSKKGFVDKDSNIFRNYGFVDGKPVQFDIGDLSYDDWIKRPENLKEEIKRIQQSLNASYSSIYHE